MNSVAILTDMKCNVVSRNIDDIFRNYLNWLLQQLQNKFIKLVLRSCTCIEP